MSTAVFFCAFSLVLCVSLTEQNSADVIQELTENDINSLSEAELLARYDVPREDPAKYKTRKGVGRSSVNQSKQDNSLTYSSLSSNLSQDIPQEVKSLLSSNISVEIKQEIIENLKQKLKSKDRVDKTMYNQPSTRRRFQQRNPTTGRQVTTPEQKDPKNIPGISETLQEQSRTQKTTGRQMRPASSQRLKSSNNQKNGKRRNRGRKALVEHTEPEEMNGESEDKTKKRRAHSEEGATYHRERSIINPFQSKVDTLNKTTKARGPLYRIKPRYEDLNKQTRMSKVDEEERLVPPSDLTEDPTELDPYVYFGNDPTPQAYRRKVSTSNRLTRRTRGSLTNQNKEALENEKKKRDSAAKDMTSLHFASRYRNRNKVLSLIVEFVGYILLHRCHPLHLNHQLLLFLLV